MQSFASITFTFLLNHARTDSSEEYRFLKTKLKSKSTYLIFYKSSILDAATHTTSVCDYVFLVGLHNLCGK